MSKDTFQQLIAKRGFSGSPPKVSKYRNKKVTVDGITFDSQKEARRWGELVLFQRAGQIRDLQRQVVFELAPSAVVDLRKRPPLRYVADFSYFRVEAGGKQVVEDCKGVITQGFRIKRHLMKTVHNIDILLT